MLEERCAIGGEAGGERRTREMLSCVSTVWSDSSHWPRSLAALGQGELEGLVLAPRLSIASMTFLATAVSSFLLGWKELRRAPCARKHL